MSKIETLTQAQVDRFPYYVEKWTRIGLSTEPCDFEKAKKFASAAYSQVGLPKPKFILCDGPISAGIVSCLLKEDSVRGSVWDSVRDSVWNSVRNSVWDSVWDSVGANVRDSVGANVRDSCFGSHDAGWLSFYDFFLSELNLAVCEKLKPLIGLADNCGWWIPMQNVCILQHRHNILKLDDSGRLHCPDGYAAGYRDGWGVYAWHGVIVPEQVIMEPETLTVKQIETESNTEIRRVMTERFGHARFLKESGATVIHADDFGTLYRKEIPDDEPIVMVHVINSTPELDGSFKDYFLRVPPDMTKAREAVAWTFPIEGTEYAPVLQT